MPGCKTTLLRQPRVRDRPQCLVGCRVPARLVLDDLQDLDEAQRGPETAKRRELSGVDGGTQPMTGAAVSGSSGAALRGCKG
jgi:hypothetical protein